MERRSILPSPFGGFATPSLRQSGDPFLALHREMNRLFDEAFRGFCMPEGGSGTGALAAVGVATPRIDVSESDQQLMVRAELPASIRTMRLKINRESCGSLSKIWYCRKC